MRTKADIFVSLIVVALAASLGSCAGSVTLRPGNASLPPGGGVLVSPAGADVASSTAVGPAEPPPAMRPAEPPSSHTVSPDPNAVTLPATLPAGAPAVDVPILMYHFVDDFPPPAGRWAAGLTVSTGMFRQQMDYLAGHGYHPVTLEAVYAAMAGQKTLPPNPVVITFDDGNMDNFTVAFPILRAHGFVATFFVITGFVGNRLSMTWEDLRAMQAAGMAIESHTYDHKDLRYVDGITLQRELAWSRDAIARQLGKAPLVLCYPCGKYDQTVVIAAQSAGYLIAVTTVPGAHLDASTRYSWPRVRVESQETLKEFVSALT